jgi:hypothetical protein
VRHEVIGQTFGEVEGFDEHAELVARLVRCQPLGEFERVEDFGRLPAGEFALQHANVHVRVMRDERGHIKARTYFVGDHLQAGLLGHVLGGDAVNTGSEVLDRPVGLDQPACRLTDLAAHDRDHSQLHQVGRLLAVALDVDHGVVNACPVGHDASSSPHPISARPWRFCGTASHVSPVISPRYLPGMPDT